MKKGVRAIARAIRWQYVLLEQEMRRYFRGLEWICEFGHHNVYDTGLMRLPAERRSVIEQNMIRGGAWCPRCEAIVSVDLFGNIVRRGLAKEI